MPLTLRQKLVVLVAVVFLPLSLAIAYQLIHLYDHLRSESLERAEDEAQLAVVRLEQLQGRLAEQAWTAGRAALADGLPARRIPGYFREIGERDPSTCFALFDVNGRLLSARPRSVAESIPPPPEHAARSVVLQPVSHGPQADRGLIVYAPVIDGSRFLGIAAARVDRAGLDRIVPSSVAGGMILITDLDRRVIYSGPGQVLSDRDATSLWTVQSASRGGQAQDAWMDLPGFSARQLGVQLPADQLTVGFYTAAVDAFDHILDEAALLTAAIIATVFLSAEFARRYANDILTDIAVLSSASRRLAVGDFDVELPTGTKDEIGQLAADFSHMRNSLQTAFANEAAIAEAAASLGEASSIEAIAEVALDYTSRLLSPVSSAVTILEPESEPRVFARGADPVLAYAAEKIVPYSRLGESLSTRRMTHNGEEKLLASFPLRQASALVGRIDILLSDPSPGEAERSRLELVQSIAGQTATALTNVILYEREKLIAETLQDSLLTGLPRDPHLRFGLQYRPATVGMRVGGDFYDFVETPQGLVVLVGDISGKGLTAARQTSISKGALKSFAIDDPTPDLVLSRANSALLPQFDSGTFVTAFCALIDTSAETLVYSVAGHPPPLLLHLDGTVETLMIGGPPLGILEDAEYPLARIGFEPDETIVILSDGITEARDPAGELLGDAAVAEVLSASAGYDAETIASNVVKAAEEHAQGRLEDDLTVVVVSFAQRTDRAKEPSA